MSLPPRQYAGLELIVYQLAVEMAKKGHEVYLIAPYGTKIPDNLDTLTLIPTVKPSWNNPERDAYLSYRDKLLKLANAETIIHDHTWSAYPYLLKFTNPTLNMCHTFHGPNVFKLPNDPTTKKNIQDGAWNFIGVSNAHSKYLSEAMGNVPVTTIYNGVNPQQYPFYEGEREEYILYFGLINAMKGADTFVDILSKTPYRAVMAGEDTFISDLNFVKNLMYYISKETNIEYYGAVSYPLKKQLIQRAKLMVYPFHSQWFEAFNLAYIEAAMMGTPLLVSESGSMLELTATLPELYRAKPNNRILREDLPIIVDDLNKNFKQRSMQFHNNAMNYTLDIMVKNYLTLFEKILTFSTP
jgi:glycosyltransferase involved in cell wall biosynthesis